MGLFKACLRVITTVMSLLAFSAPLWAQEQPSEPAGGAIEEVKIPEEIESQLLKPASLLFNQALQDQTQDLILMPDRIAVILAESTDSRVKANREFLEKFFSQHVMTYYQRGTDENAESVQESKLGDLRTLISSWRGVDELREQYFGVLDNAEKRLSSGAVVSDPQEKAILIYGLASAYLSELRSSQLEESRSLKFALAERWESSVDINQRILSFVPDYRDEVSHLVAGFFNIFVEKDDAAFDDFYNHLIKPNLGGRFRDVPVDQLRRRVSQKGNYLDALNDFGSMRYLAFLNVLRTFALHPETPYYRWSADELDQIRKVAASDAPMGLITNKDLRGEIIKLSGHYLVIDAARTHRQGRTARLSEAVFMRPGVVGMVAGFSMLQLAKVFIQSNSGYWQSEAKLVEMIKKSAPESWLKSLSSADVEIRAMIRARRLELPAGASDDFKSLMSMARVNLETMTQFRTSFIAVYGEKAWERVIPESARSIGARIILEEKFLTSSAQMIGDDTTRSLASGLARIERAQSLEVGLAAKILKSNAGELAKGTIDKAAYTALLRSTHRELRLAGEAAMKMAYVEKAAQSSWGRRMLQGALYRADLFKSRAWNMPIWREWKAVGLKPGDAITVNQFTARSVGGFLLKSSGYILFAISAGMTAIDIWNAFTNKGIEEGYENLRAQYQAQPMVAKEVESSIKKKLISQLEKELTESFELASKGSINLNRAKKNLPGIEVLVGAESVDTVNLMTSVPTYAYVLFKVREDSVDSSVDGVDMASNEGMLTSFDQRRQNAMSGVLVRYRFVAEGRDQALAKELGMTRPEHIVPERMYWKFDSAVNLVDVLDKSSAEDRAAQEAALALGMRRPPTLPLVLSGMVKFSGENLDMGAVSPQMIVVPSKAAAVFQGVKGKGIFQ